MIKKVKKMENFFPVVLFENDDLLLYKNSAFYVLSNKEVSRLCNIESSLLRRTLERIRIFSRRFGLFEAKGVPLDNENAFIYYHNEIYILNLNDGLKKVSSKKYNVLHFSLCGREVCWGDYGYNPKKKEMSIYSFDYKTGIIRLMYTFAKGEINHIHNIVFNSATNDYYVFTGDFDSSAAIYRFNSDFSKKEVVICGKQICRSCCGFIHDGFLYYATDTPLMNNYFIKLNLKTKETEYVSSLNGSVIYSGFYSHYFIFSSTVENQTDELNNRKNMYKYNKGNGIRDWYSYLYRFDFCAGKMEIIFKGKKDFLPMLPFKYGCFRFPYSTPHNRFTFAYGQAVKSLDGRLLKVGGDDEK